MFGAPFLDVAIGLTLFLLLFGLLCTAVQEALSSIMGWRSANLKKGIGQLLNDPDFTGIAGLVVDHPAIRRLSRGSGAWEVSWLKRSSGPSYVSARAFSTALMQVIDRTVRDRGEPSAQSTDEEGSNDPVAQERPVAHTPRSTHALLSQAEALIAGLPAEASGLRESLLSALTASSDKVDEIQGNLEEWFDQSMDRVSGWYRRRMRAVTFGLALGLAVLINADAIAVVRALWMSEDLRTLSSAVAEELEASDDPSDFASVAASIEALNQFPIGWSVQEPRPIAGTALPNFDPSPWWLAPFGWLLTAVSALVGAPFWFDALGRLVRLRGTGEAPGRRNTAERAPGP